MTLNWKVTRISAQTEDGWSAVIQCLEAAPLGWTAAVTSPTGQSLAEHRLMNKAKATAWCEARVREGGDEQ